MSQKYAERWFRITISSILQPRQGRRNRFPHLVPWSIGVDRPRASAESFMLARIFCFGAVSALSAQGHKRASGLGERPGRPHHNGRAAWVRHRNGLLVPKSDLGDICSGCYLFEVHRNTIPSLEQPRATVAFVGHIDYLGGDFQHSENAAPFVHAPCDHTM